jgi:P-type Cu+ transporter
MHKTIIIKITGMTCHSCVGHIEHAIKKLPGIHTVSVSLVAEKAEIGFDDEKVNKQQILDAIKKTGYKPEETDDDTKNSNHTGMQHENSSHHDHSAMESKKEIRSKLNKVIYGGSISAILLIISFVIDLPYEHYLMFFLTLSILIYTGKDFYIKGIPALLKLRPQMDTLIALGVSAAFLYSTYSVLFTHGKEEYFMDAAIISTFIILGRYLEAKAKGSAGEAIKKLMQLSAKTAHKLQKNGETIDVPIDQIQKGDLLLVKPGEKIPTDGEIVNGIAVIDESMITGESIPVDKQAGNKVIGATINSNTSFTMRADKIGKETMLSQMIKLVESAQMHKAPIQKLVDLISNYFVWAVIVIAIFTFTMWYLISGSIAGAIIPTVAVLIIACPCALGLATPISVVTGSGKGAELGILLKKPESLEKMHKITAICFDKTGTITKGNPEVVNFEVTDGNKENILQIAVSLENNSEHPLARSIVEYGKSRKIKILPAKHFTATTGKGISAKIAENNYSFGSTTFMKEKNIDLSKIEKQIDSLHQQGNTVLLLSDEKKVLAYFGVRDQIKETSKNAIKILHKQKIKTVMLTGDNEKVAKAIAHEVGIDDYLAQVTPEQKTKKISELIKSGEFVAMVGDGINDAPALALANVGIAMGTGTDIAIESGDIVLVQGDLMKAVEAIELSKATYTNIKQNLFWAFIYNSVGIPIAVAGLLSPVFSAFAMAFSSISVVLNALRLKKFRPLDQSKLPNT